jgi:5-methylcytosine-specific restriction endonuclease McrA
VFDHEVKKAVFNKFKGKCRYCEKQLSFNNYGLNNHRGAWQVDHSRSKANGGTDHMNNLFAACVDCNQDKGARNGKSYIQSRRAQNSRVSTRKELGLWERLGQWFS